MEINLGKDESEAKIKIFHIVTPSLVLNITYKLDNQYNEYR